MTMSLQSRFRSWARRPSSDLLLTRALLGRGFVGILDLVPGAAFAVSRMVLSSAFLKVSIERCRRSTDSDEVDVLPDLTAPWPQITLNSPIVGSGATYGDFLGSADGFAPLMTDQSGNGNHPVQATAGSQPRLAVAGALVGDANGRPNIWKPDGQARFLNLASHVAAGPAATVFGVYTAPINNSWLIADQVTGNVSVYGRRSDGSYIIRGTSTVLSAGVHPSTVGVRTAIFAGASSSIRDNGAVVASGTTDAVLGFNQILNFAGGSAGDIRASAIIVYASNQSTNAATLESSLAAMSGITLT